MVIPAWLLKLLASEAMAQGTDSQQETADVLGTGVEANKASQFAGMALSGLKGMTEKGVKEGVKRVGKSSLGAVDLGKIKVTPAGNALDNSLIKNITETAKQAIKKSPEKWNLAKGIGDTIWGLGRGLVKESLFMPIDPKEQMWADYVGSFVPKVAKIRGGAPFGTQIFAQNQKINSFEPERAMQNWLLKQQLTPKKDITPLQAANLLRDPFAKQTLTPKVYNYLKKIAEQMGDTQINPIDFMGSGVGIGSSTGVDTQDIDDYSTTNW